MSNIEFRFSPADKCLSSAVLYSMKDHSFYTYPMAETDYTIMCRGAYTGLHFAIWNHRAYSLSGLNPCHTWEKIRICQPQFVDGELYVEVHAEIGRGIGYDYVADWKTYYDETNQIVCIGTPGAQSRTNVRFLENCIASFENNELMALYICNISICLTPDKAR